MLPGLKPIILKMMDDPYAFHSDHAEDGGRKILRAVRPDAKSTNQQVTEAVAHRAAFDFPLGHSVFVPDHGPGSGGDPVIALVHELSHVQFGAFLEANADRVLGKFPADLVHKLTDGRFEVDEQLISYLYERHAHEAEFRILKAAHGRYFPDWVEKWDDPSVMEWSESRRRIIADTVSRSYEITDPRILALNRIPLSKILRDGFH